MRLHNTLARTLSDINGIAHGEIDTRAVLSEREREEAL